MDTSVPDIEFNENNQCNFCTSHISRLEYEKNQYQESSLKTLVERIKKSRGNSEYDCIIGVSGGVDSTYTAYIVKKILGLNPLAVHFDNGWNSELAVKNIHNCLDKLNIDLHTHVVDWPEFREVQKSLILSSIKNIEMVSDHAILSLLLKTANKHNIKFVLHGGNNATEGIMPLSWMETNHDKKLLTSIVKQFSNQKIVTLPTIGLFEFFHLLFIKKIKYIPILNYFDYDKESSIEILKKELEYRPYKFKHDESIITRFFQRYILLEKYNIDKRRPHYSNLIISGQLTRLEAINLLKEPTYDKIEFEKDKEFFLKKFDFDEAAFDKILNEKPKSAKDYPSNSILFNFIYRFSNLIRRATR